MWQTSTPLKDLPWVLLAFLLGAGCVGPPTAEGAAPSVRGRVLFAGEVPAAVRAPLEQAMSEVFGKDEYVSRRWLVGPEGGLANCAISIYPKEGTETPAAEPLVDATFDKVGPYYQPQVLVVTPGTEITLRNRESPCRGFRFIGVRRNEGLNAMIAAGGERRWTARRPEVLQVGCDLRPYIHGAIVIVDSPYFATTDESGRFTIQGVAPGSYRLRAFHEGLGYWIRGQDLEVDELGGLSLELRASVQR